MRKYLVGILIGFLLSIPISAYGQEIASMIGKKVQAENTVIVNGVELSVKSVNIDGTTYSPNRAIAEALKMDIKFEDQKVIFEDAVSPKAEGVINVDETNETNEEVSDRIGKLNTEILFLYSDLSKIDVEYRGKDIPEEIYAEVEKINQKISDLEAEKAALEAQLTAQ